MKCAICKAAIEDNQYYASIDIIENGGRRCVALNVCDSCMITTFGKYKQSGQYKIRVKKHKRHAHVANTPLREVCGPVWMFAKPQVDGLF